MSEGIRLCISGALGRMGTKVVKLVKSDPDIDLVGGIDLIDGGGTPTAMVRDGLVIVDAKSSRDVSNILGSTDVLLIFHNDPTAVAGQVQLAAKRKVATVIGTTGLDGKTRNMIIGCATYIPIIATSNFSLGVAFLDWVVSQAAKKLAGFDADVFEEHHGRKKDAPSGTGRMLAETICQARRWNPTKAIQCSMPEGPRPEGIIGMQSSRIGNIPGTHQVTFAGRNEVLRLQHKALDPILFAEGAIAAVKWIAGEKLPGLYNIAGVLGLK